MKSILHYLVLVNLLFITNETLGEQRKASSDIATLAEHHRIIKQYTLKIKSANTYSKMEAAKLVEEVGGHLTNAKAKSRQLYKSLKRQERKECKIRFALMQKQYEEALAHQRTLLHQLALASSPTDQIWVNTVSIETSLDRIASVLKI